MKNDGTIRGRLKMTLYWPFYVLPAVLAVALIVCVLESGAVAAALIFACAYTIFSCWWFLFWKPRLTKEMVNFATSFDHVQRKQLEEIPIPYALVDEKGNFLWMNRSFEKITFENPHYQKHLSNLFPELSDRLPGEGEQKTDHIHFEGTDFRVEMQWIPCDTPLISVSLFDETDHLATLAEMEEQKAALGLIYVDNYEEVMNSTEQVRQSLLAALIERKINQYFGAHEGIVRKMEKDKFFLLLKQKGLKKVEEERFQILEDVKSLNIGNETSVTLSISVGVGGETYARNSDYARMAMDLALGRGGDQAIVRNSEGNKYFGGKTQQKETSTRVKARVKAQALKELLATKDQLLIMGHKLADFDSFGAGVGIFRAAKTLGKKASIVLDNVTSSVRPMKERFEGNSDYPEDMFISGEQALELLDENTTVVLVDVNKPSYSECPELVGRASSIVVLDHHRQGGETVERATLSYIEPYASSACEMVAEILQYFSDDLKLKTVEAEALYAGIVVDTNNFLSKTGVRTFEAAAFLRRSGADMTRVRKLFRERMEDYRAKAETLRNAEIFEEAFALGICPSEGIESPMIVGAQAANELLGVIGVKASIVFTKFEDKVYVSARSIDEVNVQLIMERLGGGGHLGTAGTQLTGCTVEEAKALVKETILQMLEEGAI
ncbi:DHH family phosphoesterase [Hominifimenecus sp. rT4P-3]|uniref:DHH family phosphoesterase n=1 Tax=Hominifimenecus sp. rT4P-3 TaxID=3242979 RepID=UPI003DA4CDE6